MNIISLSKYSLLSVLSLGLVSFTSTLSQAKNKEITYDVRVIDSVSLLSGKTQIYLWGIEKIKSDSTVFNLKTRKALEDKIGGKQITCTIKARSTSSSRIRAQCINDREEDLSLFLLQYGYVTADRGDIYGSVYEEPYLSAENKAQSDNKGIWGDKSSSSFLEGSEDNSFMKFALLLMGIFITALGVLSFYIMRNFSKVVDVQNHSMDLAVRERKIKDKEKYVIASMIYAEVKSNKSKIDAYLMLYEETLRGLNDLNRTPKYQDTGDIVQKQPSLDRAVFDGNTYKLDLFGSRIASDIIHYYARIKTISDYEEIKPDMPKVEVVSIIKSVIDNAAKVNDVSDRLIELFLQNSLIKVTE